MEYQETAKATGDLVGNKNANRITKASKKLPHNNSERVTIENDGERSIFNQMIAIQKL